MPRANALTPEQNECIRAAVVELLKTKTQQEVGKILGVEQPQIGRIQAGKGGSSWPSAERLAAHLGFESAKDFFGAKTTTAPMRWTELTQRYPNLADAIGELKEKLSAETIDAARKIALHSPEDFDFRTWTEMLTDMERKARRRAKTGPEPVRSVTDEDDTPPAGR